MTPPHEQGHLADLDLGDQRVFVVPVAEQSAHVGHGDEVFGVQLGGDTAGRRIGVDVVDGAVLPAAEGGDDGDVAPVERVAQHGRVDAVTSPT